MRLHICGNTRIYTLKVMMFKRQYYLQKLIQAEGNGMVKVVTGIRRCGKSYLLFNIYRQNLLDRGVDVSHIIEVNLEDRRNRKLRDPDALLEFIDAKILDDGRYYILLDEVQLVPQFEDVLNSYLHIGNAEVYVTGSNARFLSKDIITEFRGRGWEIHIQPLSFSEYFEEIGGDKREALESYYRYGGLPAVAQMSTPEEKQNYLKEIFETVYLKDVIERNHIRNDEGLKELVRILASAIGSSTNVRRIVNTFKSSCGIDIAPRTITGYLDYLQDSFIISEAVRYDVKGRKYIGTETKYYFEDLGIRNAVIGFRQIEFNHSMENMIFNELRRQGFNVDVGLVETFNRNADGKTVRSNLEVDFVVNRADERIYIQSAYMLPTQEKADQEQASLLHIPDGFRKMIIVGDRYDSNFNDNGIQMVGIFDFLLGK